MHSRLYGASALALVLSAQLWGGAAAALTPEEAWTAWQTMATSSGQTMTATGTAREGDTLVVSGLAMGMTVPDGPVISSAIPELRFRDRGDGSVEISYPASYDVTFADPDATAGSATLVVAQDGLSLIASGTAEAPKYDFSAKTVTITPKDVKDAGGKPVDLTGAATISDVSGSYLGTAGTAGQSYDASMTAGSMVLALKANEPDQRTEFDINVTVAEPSFSGKSTTVGAEIMQSGNLSAALAAGFLIDGSYSTGAITVKVTGTESGKPGTFDLTLAGSTAKILLDAARMDYGFGVTGGAISASGFDIPMPSVSAAFGEFAYGAAMPVKASTEPQDFSALFKAVDVTMSEDLWNMFDPGAALKRDPVSVILDVDGKGAWAVDILDPNAQLDGPELPAKIFSLDLTQVLAKAAGAQVAATGALTFDNDNLQSYGGFPAPEGKVVVTMDGINALLEALVAIGVVSQDDLMGVRMGLAMLAKPGAGPDQLISEIEFRAGGSLFVNGTQMQ